MRYLPPILAALLLSAACGPERAAAQPGDAGRAVRALEGSRTQPPRLEELPVPAPQPPFGFPPLPPDPYADQLPPLPPLDEELQWHGGSYLYEPSDFLLPRNPPPSTKVEYLRLPEGWVAPQPLTLFSDFLGTGPVHLAGHWFGPDGFRWEPQFVLAGGYELFAFAAHENRRDAVAVGHQLLLDFDLRLTGTERFHVQWRPLGQEGTGGSFYQFTDPSGYVNNGTAVPDRYWFEGELYSMFSSYLDPFAVRDINVTAGKFPVLLHNTLLMNDDILGLAISKNNQRLGTLSNLNIQFLYGANDVDTTSQQSNQLYGVHLSLDHRRDFYELTYALLRNPDLSGRDAHYAGISRTKFYGPTTIALRALLKLGDGNGTGSGQLFVMESNRTRCFDSIPWGVTHGVFFLNGFVATPGWNSIAGGNFNRLRSSFAVNPLVRIAANLGPGDRWGLAGGVQLFRHHEDESWIPEIALENVDDQPVVGIGLRYLRKLGPRTYCEALGLVNESPDARLDRAGLFASWIILF